VQLDDSAWRVRLITVTPEERSNRGRPPQDSPEEQWRRNVSKRDALDGRLAIAATKGDHVAFTAIVKRHKGWIYRYLVRHLHNDEDAHDVMQEIFLSVWQHLLRYDPQRSFKIWLSQIVLNKTRDRVRRTTVQLKAIEHFGTIEGEAPISVVRPETMLIRDQALLRIEAALDHLAPQYKEALALTVIEDLSHLEVAAQIGVSRKIVENRVFHAKERLATILRASDLRDLVSVDAPVLSRRR
jgi:RNA polymerase sigma-70 factor (ECF subfamily)